MNEEMTEEPAAKTETDINREMLSAVVDHYRNPDPSIVSKLDRGKGVKLDYVSHADTTIQLCQIDPIWNYEYVRNPDGTMLLTDSGPNWVIEGWLTLHGVTRPCIGSCEKRKVEIHKELTGDLIRNGAMRFGVNTKLWSKLDDVTDGNNRVPTKTEPEPDRLMTDDEFEKFVAACEKAGVSSLEILETLEISEVPMLSRRPALLAEYTRRKNVVAEAAVSPAETVQPAVLVDDVSELAEPAGEALLASKAQVKKIQTLFGVVGVKDRTARLHMVAELLGLDEAPKSTNVLGTDQAHELINKLEEAAADQVDLGGETT
jgi:hypothetical protein